MPSDPSHPAQPIPNNDPPSPRLHLRRQIFHILHKPSPANRMARYANYVLTALILINCAAVALETMPELYASYKTLFLSLEYVSTVMFSIEYLTRVWVCVEQDQFSRPVSGRLHYMLQPLPVFDFIVIITLLTPVDLRFLRIFRISRLLRVLNLGDIDHSLRAVLHAIGNRRSMLLVSVAMMLIAIYFAASALYILENKAQPDKFASIPATLWWAVTTLTTIGYGDIYPITPWGKFCASVISVFGIGVFALPTAILTAAILDSSHAERTRHTEECGHKHDHCPHCGKKLE